MPSDGVLLRTERLELRAFRESDFDLLVELDSDPGVMRWLTGGVPTPPDVVQAKVLPRFVKYDVEQPAFGYWAAIERATGEFIGWFGFHPREDGPRDEVDVGYRLRRSAWGRGVATEGARGLVRMAFEELDVRRVVARTYEHNLRVAACGREGGIAVGAPVSTGGG
jgi:RimJ/RimL family protein N-acetyltransferase